MRAVIQRVHSASVKVETSLVSSIRKGLLILVGIEIEDSLEEATLMASKISKLRIFEDNEGKMNLNCLEAGGSTLCVSQFTLLGNVRRGNRPSFKLSAQSKDAYPIWKHFCSSIRDNGLRCAEGEFGSNMSVQSVNYGPLTLVIDSNDLKLPRRS